MKKLLLCIAAGLISINFCGCVALLAGGAAGGVGTAIWLSGKMVQRVDAPMEQVAQAAKAALHSLKLSVVLKETTSAGVVQVRSYDVDGEKIWVDIHKITDTSSQIQVRVGTIFSNKESTDRILKLILQYL
jgi:uncharacterized iron-regulated membrane protein